MNRRIVSSAFLLIMFISPTILFADGADFDRPSSHCVAIVDTKTARNIFIPSKVVVEDLNQLFGKLPDVTTDNSSVSKKKNTLYQWNIDGAMVLIALDNDSELAMVYIRYNTRYTLVGLNGMPFGKDYLISALGKPIGVFSATGNDQDDFKLIPYQNLAYPALRFDYHAKDDYVDGFRILGEAWYRFLEKDFYSSLLKK